MELKTAPEKYPESPLWSPNTLQKIKDYVRWVQWKFSWLGRPRRVFYFVGTNYPYFEHRYNRTWVNERAVEIPIIWDLVLKNQGKRVLEFGNVLSHYFDVQHEVVDKYEPGARIINQDILEFSPQKPYDLIVSISTIEHVGWDETPKSPEKLGEAIKHLKTLLAPGGVCVLTIPIGYNPALDQLLQSPNNPFSPCYFLKRKNKDHDWGEVQAEGVRECRYDDPFPAANGLAIAYLRG